MAIGKLLRLTLAAVIACGVNVTSAQHAGQERIVGLPCEGCEAVFVKMPATIGSHSRIAPVAERGEPMKLRGRILDAHGAAALDDAVARGQHAAPPLTHQHLAGRAACDRDLQPVRATEPQPHRGGPSSDREPVAA